MFYSLRKRVLSGLRPPLTTYSRLSTIYALSSGRGKCGVSVVRVSGEGVREVLEAMCGGEPPPRVATLRRIRHPITQDFLDRGLVLWFPKPKSFTGEDCCELHVHGGPAVVSATLGALSQLKGFRQAEPGEFTKRAFYAGKLDLTGAEGLADLIHSETEMQRRQALLQMEGALYKQTTLWKDTLVNAVAMMEAYIDFSEDQHLDEGIFPQVKAQILALHHELESHLSQGKRGERVREGVLTSLLGAPNVGKSSLLNLLCGTEAAIVSPTPGTTRDLIKRHVDIKGFPLTLCDTAGLRSHSNDPVEVEGMSRAVGTATTSDLLLVVVDCREYVRWAGGGESAPHLERFFLHHLKTLGVERDPTSPSCPPKWLVVFNKVDLLDDASLIKRTTETSAGAASYISCKTQEGLEGLITTLTAHLEDLCVGGRGEGAVVTQARHMGVLRECSESLSAAAAATSESTVDLSAHHLRLALNALGRLTGHVSSDDVLSLIFKQFCVGK